MLLDRPETHGLAKGHFGTIATDMPGAAPANETGQLLGFIRDNLSERTQEILFAACGLRTGVVPSMRVVGGPYGITPERVRQILLSCKELLRFTGQREAELLTTTCRQFGGYPGNDLPILSEVCQAEAQAIFPAEGATLAGVNNVLTAIGRHTGYVTRIWGEKPILISEAICTKLPSWRRVATLAMRHAKTYGAISTRQLVRLVVDKIPGMDALFTLDMAQVYLDAMPSMDEVFAEQDRWFLFDAVPNPVSRAQAIAKELGQVRLDDSYVRPPRPTTRDDINQIPDDVFYYVLMSFGFELEDGQASLPNPATTEAELKLTATQRQMVEILRAAGRPMHRFEFLNACEAANINRRTATIYYYRFAIFSRDGDMVSLNQAMSG